MNEPTRAGSNESSATDKGKVGGSGQPGESHSAARAETEGHITRLAPLELVIPTSAKAMATALMQHADELRRVAEHLKNKKKGEHIHVPLCITFYCNGGGDG